MLSDFLRAASEILIEPVVVLPLSLVRGNRAWEEIPRTESWTPPAPLKPSQSFICIEPTRRKVRKSVDTKAESKHRLLSTRLCIWGRRIAPLILVYKCIMKCRKAILYWSRVNFKTKWANDPIANDPFVMICIPSYFVPYKYRQVSIASSWSHFSDIKWMTHNDYLLDEIKWLVSLFLNWKCCLDIFTNVNSALKMRTRWHTAMDTWYRSENQELGLPISTFECDSLQDPCGPHYRHPCASNNCESTYLSVSKQLR